ncbi:hypothetical protein BGW42_002831 [Actinomortierella wolfii]|nr:hypothetical protein BGW42_002831 [Actinomortierella wolfii]
MQPSESTEGHRNHATTNASASTSSRSSFMAKFYMPMNPGANPSPPVPPPQQQQPLQQQHQYSPLTHASVPPVPTAPPTTEAGSGPSLGPDAALLVARLAATPGFLTASAIAEARQEIMAATTTTAPVQQQSSYGVTGSDTVGMYGSAYPLSSQIHPGGNGAQSSSTWTPSPYYPQQSLGGVQSTSLFANQGSMQDNSQQYQQQSFYQHQQPQYQQHQLQHQYQQQYPRHQPEQQYQKLEQQTPPPPPPQQQQQTTASAPEESIMRDTNSTAEYVKNGKMTSKLIKRLADMAESSESTMLKNQLAMLQKKQNEKERDLFNRRKELTSRHAKELNSQQAKEIMGINVTAERGTMKKRHAQELMQFDKNVGLEMDEVVAEQQRVMAQSGVPMMHPTCDPAEIGVQVKILRLLEDMLNNEA